MAADLGRVGLNALLATGLSAVYFVVPWAFLGRITRQRASDAS